jgi:hypothetical protein
MELCKQCGSDKISKLWNFEHPKESQFRGWYCCECHYIERPIGREHQFKFEGKEKRG